MYPPIKKEITAAGFVPVTLPASNGCTSLSLWTEDGAYWEYATSEAGTDAIKVTTDGTNCLQISLNNIYGPGATVCYAKGSTTTNLVGLITKL